MRERERKRKRDRGWEGMLLNTDVSPNIAVDYL